jgi:hypothetical protein
MRPPPGGTSPQRLRLSAAQTRRIMISARSGSRGITSRSVGGAAAGAPASGIAAPGPGVLGLGAPIAARAVWQVAGLDPGAVRHEILDCAGLLDGGELILLRRLRRLRRRCCAAAGASGLVSVAALGATAPTALAHGADNCAALRSRHCSASRPPGCTPEQCVMKSDRQACRIAAISSGLGCAAAGSASAIGSSTNTVNAATSRTPEQDGPPGPGGRRCAQAQPALSGQSTSCFR